MLWVADHQRADGHGGPLDSEVAIDSLLLDSHLAAPHELPELIARHAAKLGAVEVVAFLADLQQVMLVPFLGSGGAGTTRQIEPLRVDGTMAGRSFQNVEVLTRRDADGGVWVWLPLLDGTDRIGVLGLSVDAPIAELVVGNPLIRRLQRFATATADLIVSKTRYGDTIVRLRRLAEMGLAAELQWSLLPPLTFASGQVTLAGALEPAYEVAGDTLDYAVDFGLARAAVFDGMGHGLASSQLAAMAITAYRSARRSGHALIDTCDAIHAALIESFTGSAFTTGVLTELDTSTGLLTWVNAGHPEPLLLRDGKLVKTLYTPPVLPLGLRVNGIERPPTTCGQEYLEPGDRILLYTDGVTEARSPDGEFFGEQRLADLLTRNLAARLPTPETMRRVVRTLLDHQQGQLTDDATLLLIEWRPEHIDSLLPK